MSLLHVLAWYGTLVRLGRTFNQRNKVSTVPSQKLRTVLFIKNWGVPYCHALRLVHNNCPSFRKNAISIYPV